MYYATYNLPTDNIFLFQMYPVEDLYTQNRNPDT